MAREFETGLCRWVCRNAGQGLPYLTVALLRDRGLNYEGGWGRRGGGGGGEVVSGRMGSLMLSISDFPLLKSY